MMSQNDTSKVIYMLKAHNPMSHLIQLRIHLDSSPLEMSHLDPQCPGRSVMSDADSVSVCRYNKFKHHLSETFELSVPSGINCASHVAPHCSRLRRLDSFTRNVTRYDDGDEWTESDAVA